MPDTYRGKIVLITGTSSGIGLHTAVLLAQHGFTVIATMRDTAKAGPLEACAQEAGVSIEVCQLDVEDEVSIAGCVEKVLQTYGHIDLLINNAGVGYLGTMEHTSIQDLRRMMEVNFFGVWRVTQAVFPSMRERHMGRIVTVTSIGGLLGQPFNDAYCAAKFAVEGLMESLAPEAKHLGIQLCLIEPGPVKTEFVANARKPELESVPEPYRARLADYMTMGQKAYRALGQSGEEVARVIVKAATRRVPAFRYTPSRKAKLLILVQLATKLWLIR
jgi:NAD(P)-dependent dehydrogenase (short-subunit alcohol dehydrogenase family)